MDKSFIQEAFKQVYLTEDAEEFSLNVSGPDDTESFMDIVNSDEYADDEMISDVYDLEAEAKEDLKQSYIGKVILDCNVCHSNVFFNKDEITENEDGICCEEIECPYCMSNEGYTIIGEVKPYQEEEDVDIDDIESAEIPEEEPKTEEATDDIDVEEPEEDEDLEEGLKADKVKDLSRNDRINGRKGLGRGKGLEASDDIRGPKYKELNECGDPEVMEEGALGTIGGGIAGAALGKKLGHPVLGAIGGAIAGNAIQNSFEDTNESLEECGDTEAMEEGILGTIGGGIAGAVLTKSPAGAVKGAQIGDMIGDVVGGVFNKEDEIGDFKPVTEGIEDVSINTDDENITMTTKEDGGVVVETSPKEEFEDTSVEEFSGDEMIAPLEPETESDVEDAIEVNTDSEETPEDEMFDELSDEDMSEEGEEGLAPEDEFEEFDEESFNGLGESYLKRCYENVTSFKTSNITLNENKEFVIEGKIGFDSGNKKDTQFVFSTKSNDNGKLKLEGYNKQISKGKKTFKLNCSINNKALVCESLNYNYKGKNDLNESVRVYGTVKRK